MSESNPTPIGERQARGLAMADRFRIRREGDEWIVPSESSSAKYRVDRAAGSCTCPDHVVRTNGIGNSYDGLWSHMWHYYTFNRGAFLEHYHKRSNVETTMSMIKAKFGPSVRSKTPDAQVNEVLLKVLCHNIVMLVQSIYELDLEPVFWTFEAERAVAPKVGSFPLF